MSAETNFSHYSINVLSISILLSCYHDVQMIDTNRRPLVKVTKYTILFKLLVSNYTVEHDKHRVCVDI